MLLRPSHLGTTSVECGAIQLKSLSRQRDRRLNLYERQTSCCDYCSCSGLLGFKSERVEGKDPQVFFPQRLQSQQYLFPNRPQWIVVLCCSRMVKQTLRSKRGSWSGKRRTFQFAKLWFRKIVMSSCHFSCWLSSLLAAGGGSICFHLPSYNTTQKCW